VGPGGSQEAEYTLQAGIPAGTYHFVLDCVITAPVDLQFDLVHRRGTDDTMLATWTAQYTPIGAGQYDAQPFEYDQDAPAVDFQSGDQLVFRYTGSNTTSNEAYIPNGDGALSHGRIPNFTLP
jgi:hypothetical protein